MTSTIGRSIGNTRRALSLPRCALIEEITAFAEIVRNILKLVIQVGGYGIVFISIRFLNTMLFEHEKIQKVILVKVTRKIDQRLANLQSFIYFVRPRMKGKGVGARYGLIYHVKTNHNHSANTAMIITFNCLFSE